MKLNPRDIYYLYDNPVPYKELKLYPIHMRDYLTFNVLVQCLMLEKNSVPDVKIISMTYLEYLFHIAATDIDYFSYLDGLLRLVLNKKDEKEFSIKYGTLEKRPVFEIDEQVYNSDDFDVIREIIAEQNYIDLPDEMIQKSVRDKLDETRRFKQKLSGDKMASLEDQMIALSVYTGWELDKIYDMTIRKFFKALRRANQIIMSTIYIGASMSGFVEFKDKSVLKSWLTELDTDAFDGLTTSVEKLQGPVDFST